MQYSQTFTLLHLYKYYIKGFVPVVEGGVPSVHDVAGDGRGHEGADGEREGAHQDLVPLQVRWQPVVGLALPLLGGRALAVVVPVL